MTIKELDEKLKQKQPIRGSALGSSPSVKTDGNF